MPGQSLSELVESIVVDAYGTDEQLTAFLTVFDEEVSLPCAAQMLGVDVEVLGFDSRGMSVEVLSLVAVPSVDLLASCHWLMSDSNPERPRHGCT